MSRETVKRAKRVLKAMGKTSDIAGSEMILPNTSGDHVRSIKRAAPVDDKDLVNKEYVDSKKVESFPTSITSGSVIFSDGTNLAEDNFNLFWNSATNELQSHHIKIVSDGSQASPALKFNDTNTGFFKSGDSIRTSINNSTKMTVDATGVGIGRQPEVNNFLDVNGQSSFRGRILVRNNSNVLWFSDTGHAQFGLSTDVEIGYNKADANAKYMVAFVNTSKDASNVPVFAFGDQSIDEADLGFFDGITEPNFAVIDEDKNSYIMFGFVSDNIAEIKTNDISHII